MILFAVSFIQRQMMHDGSWYTTKSPLLCPVQSEAVEELLKAQEYITST